MEWNYFRRLLPPFGIGMGEDMHLIHILIIFTGFLLGHWSLKYLSGHKERFRTLDIILWMIIGIPSTYFIGNTLNMFLYPYYLEKPDISHKQFSFTSFYFMVFSMGAFIRGIWLHQKAYK